MSCPCYDDRHDSSEDDYWESDEWPDLVDDDDDDDE